jgi:hypothetical protein
MVDKLHRRIRKPKVLSKPELVRRICLRVGLAQPSDGRAHLNRSELMQILAYLEGSNGARHAG